MQQFMRSGYVVIDNWLQPEIAGEVSALVNASLADFPEFRDDGITWCHKEPRSARADVATDLEPGIRPATDAVFAEQVLPAFRELEEDLRLCVGMRGYRHQQ